jgi:hypothetical protein
VFASFERAKTKALNSSVNQAETEQTIVIETWPQGYCQTPEAIPFSVREIP